MTTHITSNHLDIPLSQRRRRQIPRHPVSAGIVLQRIIHIMYANGPDTQWEPDTIERVAQVLNSAGLVPKDGRRPHAPAEPVSDDCRHRRAICEEALVFLAAIRNRLRHAGARRARLAVARAMKSVDGARRHACRLHQQA